MSEVEVEKAPSTGYLFRILAVVGWSFFMGVIWFLMLASLGSQAPEPGQTIEVHQQAIGLAAVMITGCAGGGWFCGLIAIALVISILRR